jgi:hypothetical protein
LSQSRVAGRDGAGIGAAGRTIRTATNLVGMDFLCPFDGRCFRLRASGRCIVVGAVAAVAYRHPPGRGGADE